MISCPSCTMGSNTVRAFAFFFSLVSHTTEGIPCPLLRAQRWLLVSKLNSGRSKLRSGLHEMRVSTSGLHKMRVSIQDFPEGKDSESRFKIWLVHDRIYQAMTGI